MLEAEIFDLLLQASFLIPENPFALQERDEHTSLVLASSSLHGPVLWLLH